MDEEKQVAEVAAKEESVNAEGEKQRISKYWLEYRFIPYIVSKFNQKDDADMPLTALYDIRWWEAVLTDKNDAEFDFADIKVTKDYLSNGSRVLLYEFPDADEVPLAKYGAIVIDKNDYATYFTTERDENPKLWYLCMPETDAHKNCGSRRECGSLDEFKKQIEAHYDGKDERYYGNEESGSGKKNLRKTLIYAIFAIFIGVCIAVAL